MEKDAEINKAEQAAEQASASEKLDNAEFDEGAASKEEEAMKKAMAGEEEKKTEAATGSKKEEDKASSSSSDSSSSEKSDAEEDSGLSAKDVKRIKSLFNEQETEIKSLEKTIKANEKKMEEMKQL